MHPFHILAQDAAPAGLDAWGPTIAQIGIAGAVLWYVGTKLIPRLFEANEKLVVAFRDEAKAERDAFRDEAKAERDAFRDEAKAERDAHTIALNAQRVHDEKRSSEIHARIDGLASEVRSLSNRAA